MKKVKKIPKRKSPGRRRSAKKTLEESVGVSVVVDTREKNAWTFDCKLPSGMFVKKIFIDTLEAGDYTIVGYDLPDDEFGVIVERKASLEEFLRNIGKNWDTFQKELVKLSGFRTAVIIIEDDLGNVFQRYKCRTGKYGKAFNLPPDFLIKRIGEIQSLYGVSVFFASSKYIAQRLACNLFKNAILMDQKHDVYE